MRAILLKSLLQNWEAEWPDLSLGLHIHTLSYLEGYQRCLVFRYLIAFSIPCCIQSNFNWNDIFSHYRHALNSVNPKLERPWKLWNFFFILLAFVEFLSCVFFYHLLCSQGNLIYYWCPGITLWRSLFYNFFSVWTNIPHWAILQMSGLYCGPDFCMESRHSVLGMGDTARNVCPSFSALGIEPRPSYMLSKHITTELHLNWYCIFDSP